MVTISRNSRTVVVFGATGHLGTHIAIHLQSLGYKVVAVGRRTSDNGFFGSKPFSKTNEFLIKNKKEPIKW